MPRYLVKSEKTFTVQEGDTPAPVEFIVPAVIDMDTYDIRFKVLDGNLKTVLNKDSANGSIVIADQLVTINMLVADTKGKAGTHRWEAEVYNDTPEVITIGRGKFVVEPESIK